MLGIMRSVNSEDLEPALTNNNIVQSEPSDGAPGLENRVSAAPAPGEEPLDGDTPDQSSPHLAPAEPIGGPRDGDTLNQSSPHPVPAEPKEEPRDDDTLDQSSPRRARIVILTPRQIHKWKSPLLMIAFYICGLGLSLAHCTFFSKLEDSIVGSSSQQRSNLRLGTAFAFLSQICLCSSIWQCYTQWLWRSVAKTAMSLSTLNDVFGADTSIRVFLNFDMLRKFRIGSLMALCAWTLVLPPFFTPGTLFVYQSTNQVVTEQAIPYLSIGNSTDGHFYSYSPSIDGDRFNFRTVPSRVFSGPRTILTLLSTATASRGEILPVKAPYNHSSYPVSFYGPAVRCRKADPLVESKINDLLRQKMDRLVGTAKEITNAYYGFVPHFDSQGGVTAHSDVRYQTPSNASNQLWMVFKRYVEPAHEFSCDYKPYYQICSLWNATYNLHLSWENALQNITGSQEFLHQVEYPNDKPGETSNMAQHAYSAFMWAFTDQLVGSFGWFNDTSTPNNKTFGVIQSPIQHTSLLGTSDLDVFFDFNEDIGACKIPYANLSAQRQQDIDLAKNQTLDVLIEDLSFNLTVSLLHNDLLTHNTTANVTNWEDVNRYGYSPTGLFIPYALACLFTTIIVIVGLFTFKRHGVLPDRKFEDILCAAEDPEALKLALDTDPSSRRRSMRVEYNERHHTIVMQDQTVSYSEGEKVNSAQSVKNGCG